MQKQTTMDGELGLPPPCLKCRAMSRALRCIQLKAAKSHAEDGEYDMADTMLDIEEEAADGLRVLKGEST